MKISSIPALGPIGARLGRRSRARALDKAGRDGRLEEMVRRAAAEIGLTVLAPDDGEHLDFVNVVEVDGREDGIYVFAERSDAARFAAAVDHESDGEEMVVFHRGFASETAVNVGAAAERLIASERGDVLEETFGPGLAEDVREGLALGVALDRLRQVGEGGSEAAGLLRRWIRLDRRIGGGDPDPVGADRPTDHPAERAYTVVGCRGRGGTPYVTTVHTSNGPEAALDLAHDDFEEDRPHDREVELEIVAIFHGEPELVDFDAPEPTGAKGGGSG